MSRLARLALLLVLVCLALGAFAAPSQAYLFFGNYESDAIGRINSDGSRVESNWRTGIHDPVGVAAAGGRVFWASREGDFEISTVVGSSGIEGEGFEANVFEPNIAPGYIALGDNRVFVAGDIEPPCIHAGEVNSAEDAAQLWSARASDGGDEDELLAKPCIVWTGLAATESTVYWIDAGFAGWAGNENPSIKWMPADASSGPDVAVGASKLEEPFGLSADGDYIYWIDRDRIGRATIEPSGAVGAVDTEFVSGLGEAGYLTNDSNYLYWVETRLQGQTILRANKATGGEMKVLTTIPDSETDENIVYGLAATDPVAKATTNVSSLALGSREVGSGPGPGQTVVVLSLGEEALKVSAAGISGADEEDFSVQNYCPNPVPKTGSCALLVKFEPHAPGKRTATLGIETNAGPLDVELTGSGLGPEITLTPAELDFGEQEVKAGATAPQAFTIANTGNEPLYVEEVALSETANFSYQSDVEAECAGGAILPGKSCTAEFAFNPVSVGEKTATLTVSGKSPAVPTSVTATLTGVGTKPGLAITPEKVSFGQTPVGQKTPAQTVTISNPGSAPLGVTGIFASAPFHASNDCSATLAPGASCAAQVSFEPTSVGPKSSRLQVLTSYFGSNSQTVLEGSGVSPAVTLTPASADFGARNAGTGPGPVITFTYKNTGTETLAVDTVAIGGEEADEFELAEGSDGCTGATVEAGEECTVGVTFFPSSTGPQTATLLIADDVFAEPHTARLEGVGTKPLISLSTGALGFGALLAGGGTSQSFQVGNPGSGPLTIAAAELGGPGAGSYSVDASDCTAAPIPAGTANGCTVEVRFAPGAAGDLDASVEIASNASSGTDTVSLDGVSCPVMSASASGLKPPRKYAMALQLDTSTAASATLTATLRYRFKGKPRSFPLGQRGVSSGGQLVFVVPRKLRKRIAPGKRVNLLLAGSATPASPGGCGAQAVIDQALSLRVGR